MVKTDVVLHCKVKDSGLRLLGEIFNASWHFNYRSRMDDFCFGALLCQYYELCMNKDVSWLHTNTKFPTCTFQGIDTLFFCVWLLRSGCRNLCFGRPNFERIFRVDIPGVRTQKNTSPVLAFCFCLEIAVHGCCNLS